jgi:lipopolysaccharide transport system ATP-binding protein
VITNEKKWEIKDAPGNSNARIISVKLLGSKAGFFIEHKIELEVEFVNLMDEQTLNVSVSIFDEDEVYIISSPNLERLTLKRGMYRSKMIIPANFLNNRKYFFSIILVGNNFEIVAELDKIVSLEMLEEGTQRGSYFGYWGGNIRPKFSWENIQIY